MRLDGRMVRSKGKDANVRNAVGGPGILAFQHSLGRANRHQTEAGGMGQGDHGWVFLYALISIQPR